MFNSLRAELEYNSIVLAAAEILLETKIELRVYHIAGELNEVADMLSRLRINELQKRFPQLCISLYAPPTSDRQARAL